MLGNIKATKGHRNSSDQTVDSSEDAGIHPQRRQLHWEEGNADEKCHTLLPMTGTYFEDLNPGSFLHQYIDIAAFFAWNSLLRVSTKVAPLLPFILYSNASFTVRVCLDHAV